MAAQGRGLRPGGVVRALGRLSVLIGLGFAAGLLIGVLAEEPELLAGHLRGEGEDVELIAATDAPSEDDSGDPSAGEPGAPREVARADSAAAEGASPRPKTTSPPRAAAPPLPAVAAAPAARADGATWAIQVGAFADERAASGLAKDLRAKGYSVELVTASGGSSRWRVRVQPIRGKSEAESVASRLKRVEGLPTWVMPMEGRSVR